MSQHRGGGSGLLLVLLLWILASEASATATVDRCGELKIPGDDTHWRSVTPLFGGSLFHWISEKYLYEVSVQEQPECVLTLQKQIPFPPEYDFQVVMSMGPNIPSLKPELVLVPKDRPDTFLRLVASEDGSPWEVLQTLTIPDIPHDTIWEHIDLFGGAGNTASCIYLFSKDFLVAIQKLANRPMRVLSVIDLRTATPWSTTATGAAAGGYVPYLYRVFIVRCSGDCDQAPSQVDLFKVQYDGAVLLDDISTVYLATSPAFFKEVGYSFSVDDIGLLWGQSINTRHEGTAINWSLGQQSMSVANIAFQENEEFLPAVAMHTNQESQAVLFSGPIDGGNTGYTLREFEVDHGSITPVGTYSERGFRVPRVSIEVDVSGPNAWVIVGTAKAGSNWLLMYSFGSQWYRRSEGERSMLSEGSCSRPCGLLSFLDERSRSSCFPRCTCGTFSDPVCGFLLDCKDETCDCYQHMATLVFNCCPYDPYP